MMKKNNISISNYIQDYPLFEFYLDSIYMTLAQLDGEYPCFHEWYYKKVKNGLLDGTRDILVNFYKDYITGVSILKNTSFEKKICTLRVDKRFQKNGIGSSLLLDSFDHLDTQNPIITINSNKEKQFKSLFAHFGFEKAEEYMDFYNSGAKEISYNGCL